MNTKVLRLAAKHLIAKGDFAVGEDVLYGKYKNKKGKIVGFETDERGIPTVEIEPVPKGRKQNVTIGLYKIWKTKDQRQKKACVIFSKKCDGNIVLGKVRDRMYDPSVCVYHLEVDGTEMCLMFDKTTGFCEGINEHGLAIVNSSLMVLQDEREGMADGDDDPERSPDGIKIVKALTKRTIAGAIRQLIKYKPKNFQRGLKGHTLISDGRNVYALENTRIHSPKAIRLDADEVNTRTNHGIYYPGAGYTKGEDYLSSIVRQWESKKQLEKIQRKEDLMPALTQSIEKTDGATNPVRFTDKMRTTSQMVADPRKGEILLYLVPEHSTFEGVHNLLPGGRKPKLKVRVFEYPSKEELQNPYVTIPDEMESSSAHKSLSRQVAAQKLAARYKSKKKVKKQDGGDMTVYEYSDRQVADRNRKKAERIEHLRGSMKKLQTKIRKDIGSKDEKIRETALAVGLMDETFERVGNPGSAKEGHFGVTTWQVKHMSFGKGGVTITYVGKSGVNQKKTLKNPRLVKALKAACKDKDKGECALSVTASDVNAYLKPFKISAKDIRGFHANTEMKVQLKKIRKGKLPADLKEKEKKLKDEFKKALEETAASVGHEPSTLKSQYLVPGVEDSYLKDGTVNDSHTKTGSGLAKVASQGTATERRILVNALHAPVLVSRTREWWLEKAPNMYRLARTSEQKTPTVEGLRFDPNLFTILWYEDAYGNNLGEPKYSNDQPPVAPENATTQHSRFPHELTHSILVLNEDGTSSEGGRGGSTFPEDLVTAMVRSEEWDVGDAIMVAGQSCGRCMNGLAHHYGLKWGMAIGSDEYRNMGTRCSMCEHHNKSATKSPAEKEDENVQKMLRTEPKSKPPRYDLRNNRTLEEDDEDLEGMGGGDKGDRDLSLKWNKVAHRVAFRWLATPVGVSSSRLALQYQAEGGPPPPPPPAPPGGQQPPPPPQQGQQQQAPSFEEWVKEKRWPSKADNAPPGAEVGFEGLKKQDPQAAAQVREEYKKAFPGADDKGGPKQQGQQQQPGQGRSREDIDADLEEARNDEDELKETVRELSKSIAQHDKNIEALKKQKGKPKVDPSAKKEEIQKQLESEKAKAEEAKAKMKTLGEETSEAEETLKDLKDAATQHDKNIAELKEKKGKPKMDPAAEKGELRSLIHDVKGKIEKAQEKLEKMGEETGTLEQTVDKLSARMREQNANFKMYEKSFDKAQPNIQKQMKAQRDKLRKQMRRTKDEFNDAKADLKKTEKEYGTLRQKVKDQTSSTEAMEAKILEAPPADAQDQEDYDAQIKEETIKKRQAIDDYKDAAAGFKDKEKEYDSLRQAVREQEKAIQELEAKSQEEIEAVPEGDPEAQVQEEIKKKRQAEDDLDEKKDEFSEAKKKVNDLKQERKDPTGTEKKRKEKAKKEKIQRVKESLDRAEMAMKSMLGKASNLPSDSRKQIESQLNDLDEDGIEQFAVEFDRQLKKMTKQDATSESVINTANDLAKKGFSTEGLTDPEELGERMAQIAFTRNVVANPLLAGGKPVGQTEMDSNAYSGRAIDAYKQFKNLSPSLRKQGAERLRAELKGLDPDTDKAKELEAILTGMNTAHVADTGDSLKGRPQPSAGSAALIRRMVETGKIETMMRPVEDFFSPESRDAMRGALDNMSSEELGAFVIGDDPKHPFAKLRPVLDAPGDSPYQQLVKQFLVKDWMEDLWADRAVRDVMESSGAADFDDAEARAKVVMEAKGNGGPQTQEAMDAAIRIQEAQAEGKRADPEDEALVKELLGEDTGSSSAIPAERAKSVLETLKGKFKSWVVSPATAILKGLVETGDTSLLEAETLPHPDENTPEPRSKEQREKAREKARETGGGADAPKTVDEARSQFGGYQKELEKVRENLTPSQQGDHIDASVEFVEDLLEELDKKDLSSERRKEFTQDLFKEIGKMKKNVSRFSPGGKSDTPESAESGGYVKSDPEKDWYQVSEEGAKFWRAPGGSKGEGEWQSEDNGGSRKRFDTREEAEEHARGEGGGKKKPSNEDSKYSPEQVERGKKKLKALRTKLKSQTSKVSPAVRKKLEEKLDRVEQRLSGIEKGDPGDLEDLEGGSADDKKHNPGDVWRTEEGNWRAKNKDGKAKSFKDEDKAWAYSGRKPPEEKKEEDDRPNRPQVDDSNDFSGEFDIDVEDKGPTKFATGPLTARWMAHVRSIHPDDPNRPMVVFNLP